MGLAIVYLSGTSHHVFDQSAGLVADRIARSLKRSLEPETEFSYRVNLKQDAHQFPPDIPVDVASIEVAARRNGVISSAWVPVIDVLELKYLPRFTHSVSRLSALARALRALRATIRSHPLQSARALVRSSIVHNPGDKLQAAYLTLVVFILCFVFLFWLTAGITAVVEFAGGNLPGGLGLWTTALIVLAFVWFSFKHIVDILEKTGVEYVSALDYFNSSSEFDFIHDSVLELISVATQEVYESVDILSFSLGTLIATNVIYPQHSNGCSCVSKIRNWITLGFPFDLMEATRPGYFEGRALVPGKLNWINVVVKNDFLGTDFEEGSTRGIGTSGSLTRVHIPEVNICIDFAGASQERWRSATLRWDWIPFRRVNNHSIYWDQKNPQALTCFDEIVEPAGWKNSVRSVVEE
jgi:hypothetical protein